MQLNEFLDKAIKLQFVEKGRSWHGVDCWGLVVLAFREVYNIYLPVHTNGYTSVRRLNDLQTLIGNNKSEWFLTYDPQPMDCVLLKIRGIPSHIGLIINDHDGFIHIENKCMAFVDSTKNRLWSGPGYNNVEGFYRYEKTQ